MISTMIAETAEAEESLAVELPTGEIGELHCLAIKIYSPIELSSEVHDEILVEDVVVTSHVVEAETGDADHLAAAEPPPLGFVEVVPAIEDRAEVSVVQELAAAEAVESDAPREESLTRSSLVSKLHELAGSLGLIIGDVVSNCAELKTLRASEECTKSFELELTEAKSRISSLEDSLRVGEQLPNSIIESLRAQEQLNASLRDRNLQLEGELMTSLKPEDIRPALECKY